MTDPKPEKRGSIVVGVFVVAMLLALYVGAYFALSYTVEASAPSETLRYFDHQFTRKAFAPLGWLEAKLRGQGVELISPGSSPLTEVSDQY